MRDADRFPGGVGGGGGDREDGHGASLDEPEREHPSGATAGDAGAVQVGCGEDGGEDEQAGSRIVVSAKWART